MKIIKPDLSVHALQAIRQHPNRYHTGVCGPEILQFLKQNHENPDPEFYASICSVCGKRKGSHQKMKPKDIDYCYTSAIRKENPLELDTLVFDLDVENSINFIMLLFSLSKIFPNIN